MKRLIRALPFAAIIVLFGTLVYYIKNPLIPKVRVRNTVFYIYLALTPQEKELGLGNRNELKPGWGMLFPYDHKEQYTFWMKDMRFPLDFIWIADKKVVELTQDVPITTNSQITTVSPAIPVDQILELNAGDIARNNIMVGDTVTYILK